MHRLRRLKVPCPTCRGKGLLPLDTAGQDQLVCPTCEGEKLFVIEETTFDLAGKPRRALTTDRFVQIQHERAIAQ